MFLVRYRYSDYKNGFPSQIEEKSNIQKIILDIFYCL